MGSRVMTEYRTEMYAYKNIKTKRPSQGYNTEKERAWNKISGISDWEVYYKDMPIGVVYYIGTNLADWGYCNLDDEIKGHAFNKGCAVRELYEQWRKREIDFLKKIWGDK
tara:strand:- start:653 stop:982 length:330 start_codon:yes stop_codon:yes gene_type:complete